VVKQLEIQAEIDKYEPLFGFGRTLNYVMVHNA